MCLLFILLLTAQRPNSLPGDSPAPTLRSSTCRPTCRLPCRQAQPLLLLPSYFLLLLSWLDLSLSLLFLIPQTDQSRCFSRHCRRISAEPALSPPALPAPPHAATAPAPASSSSSLSLYFFLNLSSSYLKLITQPPCSNSGRVLPARPGAPVAAAGRFPLSLRAALPSPHHFPSPTSQSSLLKDRSPFPFT